MEKPHPLGSKNAHCNLTYWPTAIPHATESMSSTFERKRKQFECGEMAHIGWLVFSASHPVEVTPTMRYSMSLSPCADFFAFHSPCQHPYHLLQVKSVPIARKQIKDFAVAMETGDCIADCFSLSPLPLPPTNHMQTYGCDSWFIYHLLKKKNKKTSSQTVLTAIKLMVPKLLVPKLLKNQ